MAHTPQKKHNRKNRARLLERLEGRTMFAAPIVITKGGTYTGEWTSTDRSVAAVSVRTTEPVIILNSVVRGPGDLIESDTAHTNITVRNTRGYGVNPNVAGKTVGEFIDVYGFDNLVVENCYMEGTAGINVLDYLGDRTPNESVRIVGNKVLNIDGRKSDGAGGYLDFNERTSKIDGHTETGYEYKQFVQFDKINSVPGIEIAWNEVINEPGKSRTEDVISIYKSSGTAASPIRIHNNYIEGAYTVKPWQGDTEDANWEYDWSFSGGGIMLGDGWSSTGTAQDPAFVKAYDNTIISTTNYGMAISAGHDLEYYNNRIFSAGVLPDGRPIAAQNVGGYVWDISKKGPTRFYNNLAHHNVAGWVKANGSRNDYWTNDSSTMQNNTKYGGTVTRALEAAEHAAWQDRFEDWSGGGSPPPPPPSGGQTAYGGTTAAIFAATPTTIQAENYDNGGQGVAYHDVEANNLGGAYRSAGVDLQATTDTGGGHTVGWTRTGEWLEYTVDVKDAGTYLLQARVASTGSNGKFHVEVDGVDKTGQLVVPNTGGWHTFTTVGANVELSAGVHVVRVALDQAGSTGNVANLNWIRFAAPGSTTTPIGGTISGAVFMDANRNGARDAAEAGLSSWQVFIDANNNGWRDGSEQIAASDANGNWSFTNLPAGRYKIRITQADKTLVRTTASYFTFDVVSGSNFTTAAFGYVPA